MEPGDLDAHPGLSLHFVCVWAAFLLSLCLRLSLPQGGGDATLKGSSGLARRCSLAAGHFPLSRPAKLEQVLQSCSLPTLVCGTAGTERCASVTPSAYSSFADSKPRSHLLISNIRSCCFSARTPLCVSRALGVGSKPLSWSAETCLLLLLHVLAGSVAVCPKRTFYLPGP